MTCEVHAGSGAMLRSSATPFHSAEITRNVQHRIPVHCTCVQQASAVIAAPVRQIDSRSRDTRLYMRGPMNRASEAGLRAPRFWRNQPGQVIRQRNVVIDGQATSEFQVYRAPRPNEELLGITCDGGKTRGF